VLDIRNLTESSHKRRAGLLFHIGRSPRLISVIVIHQDRLDIRHLETQSLDVLLHGLGGIGPTRAQHDVTLGRGKQENFPISIADEVQVADDLEGLGGSREVGDLPSHLE